jgi:hypothetical protein
MHDKITGLLKGGAPVVFSRWGDGEWNCILQTHPGYWNCDGHAYFTDLGIALGKVLEGRPEYHLGIQGLARKIHGEKIDKWLGDRGLSFNWGYSDEFHDAAQRGDWAFKDIFTAKDHCIVGPGHLRSVFPGKFVEVVKQNCWLTTDETLAKIVDVIESGVETIGFCAGMASNVWIDRIAKTFSGISLIDFGSVFDPLAGVKSRAYMQ